MDTKQRINARRQMKSTIDADEYRTRARITRERFQAAHRLELEYLRNLKQVAKQVGVLVRQLAPGGVVRNIGELNSTLTQYSRMLGPWAKAVAQKMIAQVSLRDERAWKALGENIGRSLREELGGAPIGDRVRELLDAQVELITSIPLDAAERIHKLTLESITQGKRASEVAQEILRTNHVSLSKAMTIARTEVARTASVLTQARAEHLDSTHYIWRTAGDADVRDSHKKMNGKVVAWNDPPTLDNMVGHAGCFPNCRCYPEPILPEE